MKDIEKYVQKNLGNISKDDDEPEVLYKMLEHVKHVTQTLSSLNQDEELFSKSIKQFEK